MASLGLKIIQKTLLSEQLLARLPAPAAYSTRCYTTLFTRWSQAPVPQALVKHSLQYFWRAITTQKKGGPVCGPPVKLRNSLQTCSKPFGSQL